VASALRPEAGAFREDTDMSATTTRLRAVLGSRWRAWALVLAPFLLSGALLAQTTTARGQAAPPLAPGAVLSPGDAVVTGFSGIKPAEGPLPPGASPLDSFLIDTEGPAMQVFQLAAGAPPGGQLVGTQAVVKVNAADIGQVFAIAFDDAAQPSIYLGATSAYGLHIITPAPVKGGLNRLKTGQTNAQWMPGQFGKGGGPGSIWKVDGATGAVTLFATMPGNSGPGLGDLVYDKASRHFYVSDLDTGLIYRLTADGKAADTFDHGISGRPAKGLVPVADDPTKADIKSSGFKTEDPATWGYTGIGRRVWGMAIHQRRLYYTVAEGPQVWSIGLKADGGFAGDARWELDVTGLQGAAVISDMTFDGEGRLYLAQRGEQRGSYDYSVFAEPGKSTILRYRRDPAAGAWTVEDYAVGMPPDHRSGSGGAALGYRHDAAGATVRGTCDAVV
jgi:hypothetical protein